MPDSTVEKSVELLARQIEPNLAGDPTRLRQYIDFFRCKLGNDERLFAFHVTPQIGPNDRVTLQGYIEFPETRGTLNQFLRRLGFAFDDELVVVPAAEFGDFKFGFVKVAHSFSFSRPTGRRSAETDCLIGEPLHLLRKENGHLLAHSRDGYLGFVLERDVHVVDAATFAGYLEGPRVCLLRDHRCEQGELLPTGARLKWVSTDEGTVTVALPTGAAVELPAEKCTVRTASDTDIERVIQTATQLLGTRYEWGGCTSAGIDCSGLVQLGFATAGLHLPRDANQQCYVGRLTATRWHRAGMRRGDTLYFLGSDGKIRHTGLYLGDERYLHATSPAVCMNSLNPEHDDFDARRAASFAFAKRPIE